MPKIHYKAANVFTANEVRLLPGINTLSDEDLKRFLSHPGVKLRVENGDIEVLGEKSGPRSVKDVVTEVEKTFDIPVLEALKDEDGRAGVVKAVEAQIAKIKAADEGAGDKK